MSKTSRWAGYVSAALTIVYFATREGLRASGADFPDWLVPAMRALLFSAAISGSACLLTAAFASRRGPRQCAAWPGTASDKQNDISCARSPGDLVSLLSQRVLGALWLAVFGSIIVVWVRRFLMKSEQSELYFRVVATPFLLFGAIASFFLFRGALWARIAVGLLALTTAVLVIIEGWTKNEWPDADGYLGLFALVSALILLFPRPSCGRLTSL